MAGFSIRFFGSWPAPMNVRFGSEADPQREWEMALVKCRLSGCFRPEADQHVEDVGSAARSVSGGGPGAVVD